MRETLLQIQTEMIYAVMTGVLRLPDPLLASVITRTHALSKRLSGKEDTELLLRLEEMESYFSENSPLSGPIRNLVLKARPSQMKSIIRGYLVNYVYEW